MSPSFAICVIIRDEALYIKEWLAFHLLQGAASILFYDNGSTDGTSDLLAQLTKTLPVTIIDWSDQPGHFDMVQRAAYMDGATRLIGSVDFVAFIDADEFLHAGEGQTAAEALRAFSQEVSGIAINQRVFGSSGLLTYEPDLVTRRFVRCTEPDYLENRWFKTIARPEQILEFNSVHSVVLKSGRYVMSDAADLTREVDHPGLATRLGGGLLTINHYMLRSLEEYHRKQKRWQRRPEMENRYDLGYFYGRERAANTVSDNRLLSFSKRIEHTITQLEGPAPTARAGETSNVESICNPDTQGPQGPRPKT